MTQVDRAIAESIENKLISTGCPYKDTVVRGIRQNGWLESRLKGCICRFKAQIFIKKKVAAPGCIELNIISTTTTIKSYRRYTGWPITAPIVKVGPCFHF